MDVSIKSDSLIEFLSSLQEKSDKGGYVTTREICETLGIGEKKAIKLLRKAIDTGRVEHGHIYMRSIDGRIVRSNGYRLVPG